MIRNNQPAWSMDRYSLVGTKYKYEYMMKSGKERLWVLPDLPTARSDVIDSQKEVVKSFQEYARKEIIPNIEFSSKEEIWRAHWFTAAHNAAAVLIRAENGIHPQYRVFPIEHEAIRNAWYRTGPQGDKISYRCISSAGKKPLFGVFFSLESGGQYRILIELHCRPQQTTPQLEMKVETWKGPFSPVLPPASVAKAKWVVVDCGSVYLPGDHSANLFFRPLIEDVRFSSILIYPDKPGFRERSVTRFYGNNAAIEMQQRQEELEALGYI